MDEVLKIDANNKSTAGFVTDDSNAYIRNARIDDATKGLKVMIVGGVGSGTVTSITQGTGILLTPSPITTTGSVALSTAIQPIATLGTANQSIRVNAGATALEYYTPSAGTGTVTSVSVTTANGVSGSVATAITTPAITLTLGAITPTTVNGNTFTTGTYTLTGTAGKTLNFTNSLTLSGTDSTVMTFPTTSATIARTDAANTFTGTQTIGALVATTINGNTFTTGTGVLTIAASKTLTVSNSITLAGTDATTMTFPTTTATIARTDAAQTFTGIQTIPQIVNTPLAATVAANAATITRASRINNFTNSSAATMAITLSTSGALDGDLLLVRIYDFSAVAQTIGWTNTENSTVSVPTTSNGSTTLPLTIGFQYNGSSSKWRCVMSA